MVMRSGVAGGRRYGDAAPAAGDPHPNIEGASASLLVLLRSDASEEMTEHLYGNDPLLAPLLATVTGEDADRAIVDLLDRHVFWRVDRILDGRFARFRINHEHRDDIRAEILLRIISRLHKLLAAREAPIRDLPGYVSVLSFNTVDDAMRRTQPAWVKLKNRVRYALNHDPRFSMWQDGAVTLCGRREWHGRTDAARNGQWTVSRADVRECLDELFDIVGRPIELDEAVGVIAAALLRTEPDGSSDFGRAVPERPPGYDLENLQYVRYIWSEIRSLPWNQRVALLLHARDAAGESVTRLLSLTNVATLGELAQTLEMSSDEFSALWNDLPVDDHRIAAILGVPRQHVINARRTARDRLLRRSRSSGASGRGGIR